MKTIISVLLGIILLSGTVHAQDNRSYTKEPLKLTEYATDQTETLRPKEYIKLKNRLQRFYDSTSTQIVFLMINSLNGESIEEVANAIFRYNQIGSKDKNNGVLFMISKGDRKIRIEVGYGLEGVLTDATSKMIIKNVITPYLKEDNYLEGINRGVDAIEAVVRGEFTNEKFSEKMHSADEPGFMDTSLFAVLVVLAFLLIPLIIIIVVIKKGKSGSGSGYSGGSSYSSGSSSSSYSDSSSSSSSDSSSSDSGFSGGGGDSGGGGASGDY